jgi:hypothetical protein
MWPSERAMFNRHVVPSTFAMLLLAIVGCGGSPTTELGKKASPAAAADAAIKAYDTDGDGQLSLAELKAAPALLAAVDRIDTDRDGKISRGELLARFETQASGSDLIALSVNVTSQKRPLAGAQVTLTPEPYRGTGLQSYEGVTTASGNCLLQGQHVKLPGLPPGYYDAHIVAPALGIDQVVGCEVADDASGSRLMLSL